MWTDGSANSHTNFAADSGLEAEHCCIKVGGAVGAQLLGFASDILTWSRMSAIDEDQWLFARGEAAGYDLSFDDADDDDNNQSLH